MVRHFPYLWRFRVLRLIHGKGNYRPNRELLGAWARAEGGTAAFNPLNTTQPWPGATPYNTLPSGGHVWNYPSGYAGVHATAITLLNGHYDGIIRDLRSATKTARRIVEDNAHEFDVWGTGAAHILAILPKT